MKNAKIIAVAMAAILSLASFSGCMNRNKTNNAQVPSAIGETGEAVSGAIEERVESGIDQGASVLEEYNSEEDRYEYGQSNPDISGIESNSDIESRSSITDNQSVAAAMSADFSQIGALSAQKETGFPGGPVDAQNRPSGPLNYQEKYSEYGAYFIVPDSQKIYLTFDEGYENGYTSRILDILKEKNVKAVFFITYPYAQTEAALVKRMIEEGHTLGNHSTKHMVFPDMPLEEAAKDLMTLHDYVLANYGYEMSLFRPPEGAFSEQTLALAQALGYNTVLWSFAYKDYDIKNQPLGIEAVNTIVSKAHPGEICLLHAVSKTNSEILGEVIDALNAKGFTFADYFYFQ